MSIFIVCKNSPSCLLADIEINRLDLSNQLPDDDCLNAILPACNRNASNVKDIYNVYDIIPRNKLEMLYEHAMKITDEDMKEYLTIFFTSIKILCILIIQALYVCFFVHIGKQNFSNTV